MDEFKEYQACLSFRHTPGLGVRSLAKLMRGCASFSQAASQAASWPQRGLADARRSQAYLSGAWREGAAREEQLARSKRLAWVSWFDSDYPEQFRQMPDPPALLYYRGDASLLRSPCVAVVGARNCSGLGRRAACEIASGLSRAGIAVVSGMALGIDREAHIEGLKEVGGSIAVLGTGIDLVYPSRNLDIWGELSERGLVLSEFAPGTAPVPANFPIRNRIIAALSLCVVVVEAALRSGSLITARLALELGRDVFAVPGPIEYPSFQGCNRLIQNGARLYSSVDDLIETIKFELDLKYKSGVAGAAPRREPRPAGFWPQESELGEDLRQPRPEFAPCPAPCQPPRLEGFEGEIYAKLLSGEPQHVDSLTRGLACDSASVLRGLLGLELKGLVRKMPGMYYQALKGV